MKFQVLKSKTSLPNEETNLTNKYMATCFINSNKEVKVNRNESKSTNMLFSLKSKAKMKRSHQKKNELALNTLITCKNENKLDIDKRKNIRVNLKNQKNLKTVNFKQFGSTFANLFKLNVCFKKILF